MRRFIVWTLVLLVIAGGVALAVNPVFEWWQKRRQPTYITTKLTRGRVETTVNSTGTVKPVRTVSVGAFTSGPLAEVLVDFNSRVTIDQVLARIDPKLLTASVKRDEALLDTQFAERDRVKALLQQSRNNEERAKSLYKVSIDYISAIEMDQYRFSRECLEAQVKLAEASIKQAEATLSNSKANLGYTTIVSPVDGVVIERKVDRGQTVASSFQTPELFVVGEDMENSMHIFATVDEADIGMIQTAHKNKKKVTFTIDAYPDDLFKGEIDHIRKNSTTNQNVVTYPVVILTKENPDMKLMPGMTANITFHIETKENVLRVPMSALRFVPLAGQVHEDDRHYLDNTTAAPSGSQRRASEKVEQAQKRRQRVVWMREDDWLRARPVTLGLIEHQFAEIMTSDLTEGAELVTGMESLLGGPR
ncbi:MAG: efflux RND transporter periplasmic adaptor subunit [Gemmataceae bacterium]|nr:efflux RND transporter periplasmic adaptor subunit [Gemmataceae bacterium]